MLASGVADLKAKGDLAELMVAKDLLKRGYKVAFPYGEDWDFDLIVCREEQLERIQVKYTRSDGVVINVKCVSASLTNGPGAPNQALHGRDHRLDCRIRRHDRRVLLR